MVQCLAQLRHIATVRTLNVTPFLELSCSCIAEEVAPLLASYPLLGLAANTSNQPSAMYPLHSTGLLHVGDGRDQHVWPC
jgi:hypothetical protein